MGDWIATLPPDVAPHVLLASVDCHVGECRVLLAQNGIEFTENPTRDPGSPLSVMEKATWAFVGDDLPDGQQWNVISNGWSAAGDQQLDTALWIIMLGYKAP